MNKNSSESRQEHRGVPSDESEIIPELVLTNHFDELKAIQFRADTEYRHGWNEREPTMLKDIRFLLGHINMLNEFWNSAERELAEHER